MASDLFRALEGGEISIEGLAAVVRESGNSSFEDRAASFHARREDKEDSSASLWKNLETVSFEEFSEAAEHARAGVVFTAHPTFALGSDKRKLAARYPGPDGGANLEKWRGELAATTEAKGEEITLRYEHGEARKAIFNAQQAIRALNEKILCAAEKRFPDRWTSINPNPVSLATWVGYDLDGRTDIHWGETIRIRLEEKASQLRRYEAALD